MKSMPCDRGVGARDVTSRVKVHDILSGASFKLTAFMWTTTNELKNSI